MAELLKFNPEDLEAVQAAQASPEGNLILESDLESARAAMQPVLAKLEDYENTNRGVGAKETSEYINLMNELTPLRDRVQELMKRETEAPVKEKVPEQAVEVVERPVAEDKYKEQRIGGPSENQLEDMKFARDIGGMRNVNELCTLLRFKKAVRGSMGEIETEGMARAIEITLGAAQNLNTPDEQFANQRKALGMVLTGKYGIRQKALDLIDAARILARPERKAA